MATMHTEERIGEAWKQHRTGNNSEAISIFNDIVSKNAGHLDAHYGLGLAQRANGDTEASKESFNKALELAKEKLASLENASNNELEAYDGDRYLMLQKMIGQRLEELDVE